MSYNPNAAWETAKREARDQMQARAAAYLARRQQDVALAHRAKVPALRDELLLAGAVAAYNAIGLSLDGLNDRKDQP